MFYFIPLSQWRVFLFHSTPQAYKIYHCKERTLRRTCGGLRFSTTGITFSMICKGKKKKCQLWSYLLDPYCSWSGLNTSKSSLMCFRTVQNTDAQILNHEPVKSHTVKIELISILKLSYYNNPPKLT